MAFKLPTVAPVEVVPGRECLIDADMVAYYAGFGQDDCMLSSATRRCDERMQQMIDESQSESYTAYLTGPGNFRDHIATLQRYKGNRYDKDGKRTKEQPRWLQEIRAHLIDKWDAILCNGEEADDALGIHQAKNLREGKGSIISSGDKDLQINPGLHHNMYNGYVTEVTEFGHLEVDTKGKVRGSGLMFFYAQMLMGDNADWIKGLPKVTEEMKEIFPEIRRGGVGPKTAYQILYDSPDELQLSNTVWFCYKSYWMEHSYKHWKTGKEFKAGLGTAKKQFIEQGRLLWMRQEVAQMWEPRFQILIFINKQDMMYYV